MAVRVSHVVSASDLACTKVCLGLAVELRGNAAKVEKPLWTHYLLILY